jgi:hypothetical protein
MLFEIPLKLPLCNRLIEIGCKVFRIDFLEVRPPNAEIAEWVLSAGVISGSTPS